MPQAHLRALFEECTELPPEQRERFVTSQNLDDDTLRLLQQLLAADAHSHDLFATPATAWADSMQIELFDSETLVGSEVGGFRILSLLGEGGSAVVFRAERQVGGASQLVALKLLRNGLFSNEAQRRFRRELEILAQLSHPNIARLIDAGVSPAGVPYIATELVEGVNLADYAVSRIPDTAGRLRLLAELARTVDAAHRALIVHRDLKPSNVLVTAAGELKVLDFGIAKMLGDPNETETRHLSLTPGYAAPEQYSRGVVTTAVDVYALGVIGGELLLDVRLGADARLPRDQATAQSRRRRWMQLDPDLAVLLSVALADDPAQRYASARHFADDIERFLRLEPITARPPTRRYRLRKFLSRNGLATALAAMFVVGLLAALGAALWQARIARAEAQRASSVSTFVEGLFAPLRDGIAEGRQPSLTELVALGAARIDASPDLDPAARVDLLLLFARINDHLNVRDELQRLSGQASALADAELGRLDPLAVEAAVAHGLAALRGADYPSAARLLGDAELRLRSIGASGDAWIRLNDGLALIANDRGDPQQALLHERIALAERIAVHGDGSEEAIGGYANLGFALEGTGEFEQAAEAYRLVYASRVARTGSESSRSASALTGLGAAQLMAGQLQPAQQSLQAAMAVFDSLGGTPRSAHVQSAQQACTVEIVLATNEAGRRCAHAVEVARRAEVPAANSVGRALRLHGQWLSQAGLPEDSRRALVESQALFSDTAPENWRGRTDVAYGELVLLQGRPWEAVAWLGRGIDRLGRGYPPYLRRHAQALLAQACAESAPLAGRCAGDTAALARDAIDGDRFGWNPLLLGAHIALARIDLQYGNTLPALLRLQRVREVGRRQGLPSSHPRWVEAGWWQAATLAASGRCIEALALGSALGPVADTAAQRQPWPLDLPAAPQAETCAAMAAVRP